MKDICVFALLQDLLNAVKESLHNATGSETVLTLSVEFPNVTQSDVLSCAGLPDDISLGFHGQNGDNIKLKVTQYRDGPTLSGHVRTDVTYNSSSTPRIDIWPHNFSIRGVTGVKLMREVHKSSGSLYCTRNRGRWLLCSKGDFASENDACDPPEFVGTVTGRHGRVFFRDYIHNSTWLLVE